MFIVFGKNNCVYCTKTKETLIKQKLNFDIKNIDSEQETIDNLKKTTNHNTFPFIFHKDNFIGGYTDLLRYIYSPEFSF